ncbi:MAG: PilZ domain-containing protein [Desulfobulbaceae bacterium]|nr:PilZ domain-containing protein [Desulfobulbaceae bacterium]MCK5544292.1 PilZ domain-containing protein [Desulfobulbaceae bacterium]
MNEQDRRRNTRVDFQTTADLKFPDQEFPDCETRDLSVRGIAVLDVKGPELGDQCEISLHLSGMSSDLSLAMKGEVVRTEEDFIALHFFEIDLDSFFHLRNIVYYNTEDADKVEEEFLGQISDDIPDDFED